MTALLLRRYLAEYARRPLNVVLLAVVPVVFVILSAGAIADFARILGGPGNHTTLETATAGWAAALLAGIAGFFQVNSSRAVDRRIAAAGAGTARVVTARLATGVVLAAVAVTGALAALWLRTGITDVPRAVGATAMFALIYLAIGAGVGAVVHSELNGSLIVVFVWMFDLFLGPAMGGSSRVLTRVFPTHFPTLIMINVATHHAGPLGDLGASLLWTIGGLALATIALVATTRPARTRTGGRQIGSWARMRAGIRYGFRDYRRNVALWVLLVTLPVAFITLSIAVTPDNPVPVSLLEHGRRAITILRMPTVHGAIMVPITIAFLSGLAGLFVVLGSAQADRRLTLAGFRTREILTARFAVIAFAAGLTTIVAIAVTATDFAPHQWAWFAVANVLVALTYAMLGSVGLLLAATHPDRVQSVVVVNGFARALVDVDYPEGLPLEALTQLLDRTVASPADGNSDFLVEVAPSAANDAEFRLWWELAGRRGASPGTARALLRVAIESDVRAVLPAIQVPTLVVHLRDDPLTPLRAGRYIADHVPGAHWVEVPGADDYWWASDSAGVVLDEVEEFVTGVLGTPPQNRVLSTILVTDIVSSTVRAIELGDHRWRDMLDSHDKAVRRQLARFRGTEVNTTGDGFLATFEGPARAVECACAIRDVARQLGVEVRSGVHTGEIELRGDDIAGVAVHIAARVAALAEPSTVWVSRTVTDLVTGSGIRFSDRGNHDLKGVPGTWALYAVADP